MSYVSARENGQNFEKIQKMTTFCHVTGKILNFSRMAITYYIFPLAGLPLKIVFFEDIGIPSVTLGS